MAPPSAAAGSAAVRPQRGSARPLRRNATLAAVDLPPARSFDVFESKLRVPAVRPGEVSRAGLVNRLRAERSTRLATVVAAAGYGKTRLLAQWAARDERPFAWVSIDRRDNDPLILLRHLAVAFDRVQGLGRPVFDALADPGPSVWSKAAPRLAGALSSCRAFVAVLDDADLLQTADSVDVVTAIAQVVPEGSMLVLAGRVAPALPIARLRAAGEVLELNTADLALGRREAHLLLRGAGAELDEEGVSALVARTEGWATGLALVARGAAARRSPDGGDGGDGERRHRADYFEYEHLSRLSPERRSFVRRTSVLETMTGPVCDAVLSSSESAVELDELRRSNLFVVPLDGDGDRCRYHHLFRTVLRRELERQEPELVPELNRRAADWFEAHGDLESALDYAEASGDADRAARILTAIAPPAHRAGRMEAVEGWLERFAAHAPLEEHPAVAVLGGWVKTLRGRAEAAERWLAAARLGAVRSTLPDGTAADPWIALLQSALCTEGPEAMERDVAGALKELPAESPWLATALLLRGAAAVLQGDVGGADAMFAAAAEAAERIGATETRAVALAERSLLASAAGAYEAAELLALEARDLLATGAFDGYVTTAIVRAAAARTFLRHGRWDDARAELTRAERLAAVVNHTLPWFAVQTRLAIGSAHVTLRDRSGALAQLSELERILALRPALGVLGGQVAELRRGIAEMPEPDEGHAAGLTRAELRLVPLLATHLSFREIGDRLYVSRNTIKTQAISAYRKLGVSNRSAAVERAYELGLVDERAAPAGV